MARIRTIKPEFWTSEQVAECSPNARLAFIGMWSFCDDSGVHPASTKRLKMEVFPADEFTDAQIKAMVDELVAAELLQSYEVSGQSFWRVTGWKHQKIDQPTFKHPLPSGAVPDTPDRRRESAARSPNTSRVNGGCSLPDVDLDMESKGMESNGVDGLVHEIANLHPKIHDPFHLTREVAGVIAEAIARDGRDVVWVGTKSMADATALWPATEKQFIPSAPRFFRESQYLRNPKEWERSANGKPVNKAQATVDQQLDARAAARRAVGLDH